MSIHEPKTNVSEQQEEVIDTSGMSEGKRDALEMAESARESFWEYPTFAGGLFMGKIDWDLIHPFPSKKEDFDPRGEDFLEKLDRFLEGIDADAIDRSGEIPEEVIEGLAQLGAFGVKVPREYGGLGLSQQYYSRAAMRVGSACSNLTALFSAHQSIGVPQPLLVFGTEEQKKKFLPRIAGGEISAFALTEEGVGSDPAMMLTSAEPSDDGKNFIINGKKIWCTNGTRAGLLVVMAKTPPKEIRGRMRDQVTAFIVDTKTPGVTVTHRCHFMGLRALLNAVIEFKDVVVPRENIIAGEGQGLRVALTTLNTGRITLPAACVGGMKVCLDTAVEWSNERVQWGAPVGQHGAIADKIARITAEIFATEAMTMTTSALVDRKKSDIRLEAAMAKMLGTEAGWRAVDETLQILGGRGYETDESLRARGEKPRGVERFLRDARINTIFEGSSEIMRLFIAREALDPHLRAAGDAINTRYPMGRRIKGAVKAALFYARWYPRQWIPLGGAPKARMHPALAKHCRFVTRYSRRLARGLFHSMVRFGPKLEQQQVLLARYVEIGAELFAQAASCSYAQAEIDADPSAAEGILPVVDFFCLESQQRIKDRFRGVRKNCDARGYKLAQRVLGGMDAWLIKDRIRRVPDDGE